MILKFGGGRAFREVSRTTGRTISQPVHPAGLFTSFEELRAVVRCRVVVLLTKETGAPGPASFFLFVFSSGEGVFLILAETVSDSELCINAARTNKATHPCFRIAPETCCVRAQFCVGVFLLG